MCDLNYHTFLIPVEFHDICLNRDGTSVRFELSYFFFIPVEFHDICLNREGTSVRFEFSYFFFYSGRVS